MSGTPVSSVRAGNGLSPATGSDPVCPRLASPLRRTTPFSASYARSAGMFMNEMPYYEILSQDAMAVLDRGWKRIVSELGIEFRHPDAVNALRSAGQQVEGSVVKLDPEFVLEQVAKAPRSFELRARNPDRTIRIGGRNMAF